MGPEAFDYELPAASIAQRPAARRGQAKMLVLGPPLEHLQVDALAEALPPGALVVVNESRVVPARIDVARDDGRRFELLVAAPASGIGPGDTVAAWVRGAKKLRPGHRLTAAGLVLELVGPDDTDPRARRFTVIEGAVMPTLLAHGAVPLPPYIDRPGGPSDDDARRYQTVFARSKATAGSVAAPTAGLHLEAPMIAALDPVRIALHVGPGTFLPMDVADVSDHRVGAERVEIDDAAAQRIAAARDEGRPIVAVGTTVTRALEGVAARHGGAVVAARTTVDLVITPGFRFAVVDHLLTNFHLPRSSLLMLVCAFAGRDRVMAAYREAVARGYRFYSYGDCMLAARDRG